MSNGEGSFSVVKSGHWFHVMGDSLDPEVQSPKHRRLAYMMLNNVEVMNAYHDGFLNFDDDISYDEEEEIKAILDAAVVEDQLEYFGSEEY